MPTDSPLRSPFIAQVSSPTFWALSWVVALMLFLECATASESDLEGDKKGKRNRFKLDGRINLEVRNEDRFESVDLDKEGILQLETPRRKGVKAVFDVRVTSDSGGPELRELFLNARIGPGHRLVIGQARKRFGLAWDQDQETRLTLRRGLIYRKLGELAYSGRDSTVSYRFPRPDENVIMHEISVHTSEGLNAALLYHAIIPLNPMTFLANYSLLQGSRVDLGWNPSVAQSFSLLHLQDKFRIESEFFVGEDYYETQFNRRTQGGGAVYFSALSAGAGTQFPGSWSSLKPHARVSVIVDDLSRPEEKSFEYTLGARYYFQSRLYLGAEANLIRVGKRFGFASNLEEDVTLTSTSSLMFALRYYF